MMAASADKDRRIMADTYDSRTDTMRHIRHVRDNIETFVVEMLRRGRVHDASKFDKEERAALDEATPLLRSVSYGSPRYGEILAGMTPMLEHHYRCNGHHPEHYGAEGISGMDLFDVVEMVCDWMAAARRNQADGVKLAHNVRQFDISPQLAAILANTLARWPDPTADPRGRKD